MKYSALIPFVLFGCAVAAPPDWYHRREWREYTPEFGYIGVGSAASRAGAVDAATADIVRQFQVSVEANIESLVQSVAEGDRETIRSQYSTAVKTAASAKLKGVQTVQTAEDKGAYYALCYLDRDEFAITLAEDIAARKSVLTGIYLAADSLLNRGGVFSAVDMLLSSNEQALECDAWQSMLNIVSSQSYAVGAETASLSGPALLSRIRTILNNVRLEKISGGGQSAPRGQRLPQPLTVKTTYGMTEANRVPISGVSLDLTNVEGARLDRKITDHDGLAQFEISALGANTQTVTVSINLPLGNQIVSSILREKRIQFTYTVEAVSPLTFSISVVDENRNKVESLEQIVVGAVAAAGHKITKGAPLCFNGVVSSKSNISIGGFSGSEKIVKVKLVLTLQDSENGAKLDEAVFEAVGMGNSETEALKKAYNNLQVKADDIALLLTRAGEKLHPY